MAQVPRQGLRELLELPAWEWVMEEVRQAFPAAVLLSADSLVEVHRAQGAQRVLAWLNELKRIANPGFPDL